MNSVASGSTPEEVSSYLASNSISIESPGAPVVPVLSFDQLAISSKLRQALEGFKQPTPIQACAWPALLAGHDVVGIAETGRCACFSLHALRPLNPLASGKTLAFSVPALAHITEKADKDSKGKGKPSILVVAPTRELALQTQETMERCGAPFGIKSVCVFGGVDKGPQKKSLSNKDSRIIVGTPGRLLDLTNEGACDLSRCVKAPGKYRPTIDLHLPAEFPTLCSMRLTACWTRVSRTIFEASSREQWMAPIARL